MIECGARTRVMGILNVTPDSFSDGSQFFDRDKAVQHGLSMVDDGALIIDVGGESTRPGAAAVSDAEEIERVVPVIAELCAEIGKRAAEDESLAQVSVSIDTMKASVAEKAVEAGAVIINDVSAMTHDERMVSVAAASGAGSVLMHMRGTPRTMQDAPEYADVVSEVAEYLKGRMDVLVGAGIAAESIALDPGIGFGKTVEHNLQLLGGIGELADAGRPIVIGLSRKSFLGKLTGREVDDRLILSVAAMAFAVAQGAHIMRVHDVRESVDAVCVVDALAENERQAAVSSPAG